MNNIKPVKAWAEVDINDGHICLGTICNSEENCQMNKDEASKVFPTSSITKIIEVEIRPIDNEPTAEECLEWLDQSGCDLVNRVDCLGRHHWALIDGSSDDSISAANSILELIRNAMKEEKK